MHLALILLRRHGIAARYVSGCHGRFYGDVPPIKGVYKGAAQAEHDVNVTMTRL